MAKRRKRRRRRAVHAGWLLATAIAAFAVGFLWSRSRSAGPAPELPLEQAAETLKEVAVAEPEIAEPAVAPGTEAWARSGAEPPRGAEPPPIVPVERGSARVALVIDDLGRSAADLDRAGALGIPWTGAVLPFESRTPAIVDELRKREIEFLCHLPMQPARADPGPGALHLEMTQAELAAATRAALSAVPGASGVNNHMGSVLSADAAAMTTILRELTGRELYFLDSRTSPDSHGYRLALEMGLPAIERQVFLDVEASERGVTEQFRRLLEVARQRGAALAIGHPHEYTFSVLEREVPAALAAGYEFVPASYLLDRPALGLDGSAAQAARARP